jgi:poly-gamma-glutamate capsule biosynthesis protein CapA/YwtB (metallophosphatase superfamily)
MGEVVLLGVGDVGPIHEPIDQYAALAKDTLAAADIRFGQCERTYSERGALQVHSGGGHSRCKPHMADIFDICGFDVVSVASNHSMDWGPEPLLDTIELLNKKGIKTVGAGANLEEARKPAIIEKNGVKVGFLAYCSVLRDGYPATKNGVGVAPLRAHTFYKQFDYQAGMYPKTVTVPYEEDLAAMVEDIKSLKAKVDTVVVSIHWGIHFIPREIADYQPIAAKAAFEAGADVIFGHHAHAPKAVGVYGGKVCFYSVSNFIMSGTEKTPESAAKFEKEYRVKMDPDYPRLPYGSDGKRTMVAKAILSDKAAPKVSFLPTLIDPQLRPEILKNGDPRFDEAVNFMEWVSEDFPHKFKVDGDEVIVSG